MAINFTTFENTLVNYFQNYIANSEQETGEFLANTYETFILQGSDMFYRNPVISYNKPVLQNNFTNAMLIARNNLTFNVSVYANIINQGLIGFWSGAVLLNGIPPPGSVAVISNLVTFPGSPAPLFVYNTEDFTIFARNLVNMFKTHLFTINGITTSVVTGTGAVPFPWSGFN